MATIISGKNPVLEAIHAGRRIDMLHLQEHTNKDVAQLADGKGIPYEWMSKMDIGNLLEGNHQGVGATVADYTYQSLDQALRQPAGRRLFVLLDGLQDPHNLGAILRSADAFGVDAVVVPKHRSVGITPTVVRVSVGAIEHVDVVQVTNLHQTIRKLKDQGFWVVGTDMDAPQTIHDVQVDVDLALVIGGEGTGMGRLVRESCDYIVQIPMRGHVNSLNASVSAAIALYDIQHRRG